MSKEEPLNVLISTFLSFSFLPYPVQRLYYSILSFLLAILGAKSKYCLSAFKRHVFPGFG